MTYHRPHPEPRTKDGRALVSRAIAARLTGIPERSIRHHCPVVTYDKGGAALIDLDDVDRLAQRVA